VILVTFWVALGLAFAAGSVDGIGYLLLAHVFTSHMSGNTVEFAMHIGSGNWHEAWRHFEPIVAFVLGVGTGIALTDLVVAWRASSAFALLAACEVLLLIAFAAIAHPVREWMVAFPAGAMGMQNALLRRVGEHRVRTTYITGMLTNTAQGFVEFVICAFKRDRETRKKLSDVVLYGGIWCCFAAGGISGVFLELRYGTFSLLLPVCALAAMALSDALSPFVRISEQK
jgi:uncharacterized membrane protein YoaK (UPF0700 family)